MDKEYSKSSLSACRTHHLLNGVPMYAQRFNDVLSFHDPGFAPVKEGDMWKFIKPDGSDAFTSRYGRAFGFYEHRAAVSDEGGSYHINEKGKAVYARRYSWCGNFQEGRCPVRGHDLKYHHILPDGSRAYEEDYLYAGDFKYGIAVVRCKDGLCRHIDLSGRFIHDRMFRELDVFHKGYALAKDEIGWFHININGEEAYSRRFSKAEPFYNGQAYCVDLFGNVVIVNEQGGDIVDISSSFSGCCAGDNFKILLIGTIGAGKSSVGKYLSKELDVAHHSIDEYRHLLGDGSFTGEYRAWLKFFEACSSGECGILEFSGAGPHAYDVREALLASGSKVYVFWLDPSYDVCCSRAVNRNRHPPLPYRLPDIEESVANIRYSVSDMWEHLWSHKEGIDACRFDQIKNMGIDEIGYEILSIVGGLKDETR